MDCLENENVCSVKKEDNLDYYRIHTIWMKDRFRINIASRNGAWTGEMTPENIISFSKNLQINEDSYLAECKEALTTDDGKQGYSYMVENGTFTWKKLIDEDSGIKVKMGSIMVQPVSFPETVQNIIEVSLKCKKNLQQQINNLLRNKERDLQRVSDLQMKLDELVCMKNAMEADLYSKFLLLLNAKKRKIQELEESIVKLKNKMQLAGNIEINQESDNNSNKQILDSYEMDTEDEDKVSEGEMLTFNNSTCKKIQKKKGSKNFRNKTNLAKDACENDLNLESEKPDSKMRDQSKTKFHITCEKTSQHSSNDTQKSDSVHKLLPATKDDILDFFFGTEGHS